MEADLISCLEDLKILFYKELKDFESIRIQKILSSGDEIALGSLELLNHPLKSTLAVDLILKNISSEFNPFTIQMKLECFNCIKTYINKNLMIKELKTIKKHLKSKLFNYDIDPKEFLSYLNTIKGGAKLSDIFGIVFDSDFIQELSHLLYLLNLIKKKTLTVCDDQPITNINEIINETYNVCDDLRMSYAKKLNEKFTDLINNSHLDSQDKSCLITLNNQRYNERIKPLRVDNLCESLDKTIKELLKNSDNFEILPLQSSNMSLSVAINQINQFLENSKINFIANEENFLIVDVNKNSFQPIYFEFETIFLHTLTYMLTSLEKFLNELSEFPEFLIKGLNLYKAFKFLKTLPNNISQTICEIMIGASDPQIQSSYYKFFLRDMYKKLRFEKISDEVSNTFISLALKTPFKETLERFKKAEGITLKTQQITLKLFESRKFKEDHKLGGKFCLYLHELAHYLQRTSFDCVGQTNQRKSSKIDVSEPNEGGTFFENLVFGEELVNIYHTQAIFLLKGVYPDDIEHFRKKYHAVKKNDHEAPLPLSKSQDVLPLGKCGSLYGLVTPRWLPSQFKYEKK